MPASLRPLGPADRDAMLAYAYAREAENLFLIGNLGHPRAFADMLYVGAEESGVLTGVGMYSRLWTSAVVHAEDPETVDALTDAVLGLGLPLTDVLGFRRYAARVVGRLAMHGKEATNVSEQIVLTVTPEHFHPHHTPRARRANSADIDALAVLAREDQARPETGAVTDDERRKIDPSVTFLVEEDGRAASKANLHARSAHYAQIGGVVTHPEYRGRGYAKECVSALCADCFASGTGTMLLFTDEDNAAALRVYRALGFADAGEFVIARYE